MQEVDEDTLMDCSDNDAVVSNPEVKKLPENAILLLNEYIKRELKEKEE